MTDLKWHHYAMDALFSAASEDGLRALASLKAAVEAAPGGGPEPWAKAVERGHVSVPDVKAGFDEIFEYYEELFEIEDHLEQGLEPIVLRIIEDSRR